MRRLTNNEDKKPTIEQNVAAAVARTTGDEGRGNTHDLAPSASVGKALLELMMNPDVDIAADENDGRYDPDDFGTQINAFIDRCGKIN